MRLEEIVEFGRAVAAQQAEQDAPYMQHKAHVIGCGKALSVPVDLCECGGRDVVREQTTPRQEPEK